MRGLKTFGGTIFCGENSDKPITGNLKVFIEEKRRLPIQKFVKDPRSYFFANCKEILCPNGQFATK